VTSRLDLVALSLLWTEGDSRRPARHASPAERAAADVGAPDPRTLLGLDKVLEALAVPDAKDRAASLRRRAAQALETAAARGIGLVARGEAGYPDLLGRIYDPPPVLWTRGSLDSCSHAVAIVGSRTATPHGLEIGFRLGLGLARAGFTVVSGLARGIDAAAHRGALKAGGATIAVLGCGVDVVYPPEHAALAAEVAAGGALASEFAPGVPPHGWHFPRRNRIISGLALGVVIVEAANRSGSLITAGCAADQGRSVMAVPGGVLSGRNRGAHKLLRDGAAVVEEAKDVVEQLLADWRERLAASPPRPGSDILGARGNVADPRGPAPPPFLDPILRAMLPGEPYRLEDLASATGLGSAALMARLTRLEVDGWVVRVEGGQFVRPGRTC